MVLGDFLGGLGLRSPLMAFDFDSGEGEEFGGREEASEAGDDIGEIGEEIEIRVLVLGLERSRSSSSLSSRWRRQ